MQCCDRFLYYYILAIISPPNLLKTALPLVKLPPSLCFALNLPPLSKGGGLTARHKLCFVAFCLRYAHPFYIANFSAVKTEGLPHCHTRPALNLPTLSKVRCCRPKKFGRLPERLPHPPPTFSKLHYPTPRNNTTQQNQKPSEFSSKGFKPYIKFILS